MLIHFVGGLGGHKGRLLTNWELLAIELAHHFYPEAGIICHTDAKSWANVPTYCMVQNYEEAWYANWPNYALTHGAHMADKVRMHALLEHGGLYLDTDLYLLQRLTLPDNYAVPAIKGIAFNGLQWAPQPGEARLFEHKQLHELAEKAAYWDELSCKGLYAICAGYKESLLSANRYLASRYHKALHEPGEGILPLLRKRKVQGIHVFAVGGPFGHKPGYQPGRVFYNTIAQLVQETGINGYNLF